MKNIFLAILITLSISCKQQKIDESNNNNEIAKEKNKEMINTDETLLSGLNLAKVTFSGEKLEMKKYKYKDTYIENIKMADLLNKEYREGFFKYIANSIVDSDDEFIATFFSKLLLERIIQLKDTNAFYLLTESSKNPSISYNGIEMISEYVFDDLLENGTFYIKESSKYNDITIIEYILKDMAPRYIKTETEIKDPTRMCACDDLQKGAVLLSKDTLDVKSNLKKFKDKFKSEKIIEIDCSPSLENGWKSTTNEYYDIKLFIDKNLEIKLDNKEKIFYKVKIAPLLKDYIIK